MSIEDDFAAFRRVAGEEIAKLREEIAELRAHAERVGEANDRLVVENAERGLRLVTIEEIIDDSHRSDKAKVLALKWMLGRKEAQP